MRLFALALALALALPSMSCTRPSTTSPQPSTTSLQLSTTSGNAPLAVEITGPDRVRNQAHATFNPRGGCGFEVDWGDGARVILPAGTSCGAFLRHIYAHAGTYKVHVSTYDILPTDGRETNWSEDATVTVNGAVNGAAP